MNIAGIRRIVVVAALAQGFLCAGASAGELLSDGFDTYADQAAFQAVWPAVGSGTSGTLSSLLSVSPPNSVNMATTGQRNERSFTESGLPSAGNIVQFAFDFYDSDAAASPYRQYANLQDGASPGSYGQLISLGLNNNLTSGTFGGNYYMARILGADGGSGTSNYFKLNNPAAPLRSTGWHTLRVDISDTAFDFFVDGVAAKTIANIGTLRSYDVVRIGSGLTSTVAANYDNVSVATVPEPATWALALGGLAAAGVSMRLPKRRRKIAAVIAGRGAAAR